MYSALTSLSRQENMYFDFINLMPNRVRNILIVASVYDSFMLSQDGQLGDLIMDEFTTMNIAFIPIIHRVSSGLKALELIEHGEKYDLVLTSFRVGELEVNEFAGMVKKIKPDLPVIVLAFENRELVLMQHPGRRSNIDKVFLWQGNSRILLAIVKYIEDRNNVEEDTKCVGVQVIIVVEDNMIFYSSYLPIIYTELIRHSQKLMDEGLNIAHRIMRMRARPKILLFDNYEEAMAAFSKYRENVIGVISDVKFSKDGQKNPDAGKIFIENVRSMSQDLPVLMQSFQNKHREYANKEKISFLLKDSPNISARLRTFMVESLGFGDFVFRLKDGSEVDRASDLLTLEKKLKDIPTESIKYHAEQNHFSNWLKTRTEFALAAKLRPRKVTEYPNVEDLRNYLIKSLQETRIEKSRNTIADFNEKNFDLTSSFARIGGGSMGGKARGLAFIKHLIHNSDIVGDNIKSNISIPSTVVCCTDMFDDFMELNDLNDFSLLTENQDELYEKFDKGEFPEKYLEIFKILLEIYQDPLAIRSSSLLEDSHYQPFAGVYQTCMIANNDSDVDKRLSELVTAIKKVYSSVFTRQARIHIQSTPYRIEEEKMAIVIQPIVGKEHNHKFYPEISGVARSYNFYAKHPMSQEDGIASLAFGLGQMVVDGGNTVKISPSFPKHTIGFGTIEDYLQYTQKEFYAMNLLDETKDIYNIGEPNSYQITTAQKDGTLFAVGSVYSPENDAVYDGISRKGIPLVTFAPILKNDLFDIAGILKQLLEIAEEGVGGPIEIEFAVNMSVQQGEPFEFSIVQIRPMVMNIENNTMVIEDLVDENLICRTTMSLGIGTISDIYDILYVDPAKLDRAKTVEVAKEIEKLNNQLLEQERPYLLIGVGRWGSSDPWLGIPVNWEQIAGAKVIVETGFENIRVEPSQGAHFFHNLMSFNIGYLTINTDLKNGFIDWEWLRKKEVNQKSAFVTHLQFQNPITVKLEGQNKRGIVYKPE